MSDIKGHTISWLVGYIFVGNGTNGVTNNIYLMDQTGTYFVVANGVGNNVPVAPGDANVGAAYLADVIKHFARMRIHRSRLIAEPLQPATSNSMVVIIAPQKGASNVGGLVAIAGTTAGLTYTNVISMTGVKQAAAWEKLEIDMTPFIGGGSGAGQNEFDINPGNNAGTANGDAESLLRGVIPTTFAVSGANATGSLENTRTHAVFIEMVVDLIDYVGGNSSTDPFRSLKLVGDEKSEALTGKSAIDVKSSLPHERKRSLADVNEDLRKLSAEFKSSNEDLNACKQILKEALSSWDSKVNSEDMRRMIQRELADNTNTLRLNTETLLKQKALLLEERVRLAVIRDKEIAPSSTAAAVAEFALRTDEKDYVVLSDYAKPPLVRAQQKAGTASG
jgi:hypothetical protein